jgi:hypothetical protein
VKRVPLERKAPLRRTPLARKPGQGLKRTPIRPVSKRRVRENALRRKVCMEAFGENPSCVRCGRPADHAHELTPRSAGGSIADPSNIVPLCAQDHAWVHAHPIEARAEGWLR